MKKHEKNEKNSPFSDSSIGSEFLVALDSGGGNIKYILCTLTTNPALSLTQVVIFTSALCGFEIFLTKV